MPITTGPTARAPSGTATGDRDPGGRTPQPRTVGEVLITDVKISGPGVTVGELRTLFADSHVHAAVVVDDGVLLAMIDRADVTAEHADAELGVHLSTRDGRVVGPDHDLGHAHRLLLEQGRRRLAVAAPDGTFIGLLCLKRTLDGFCSERDTTARRAVRTA